MPEFKRNLSRKPPTTSPPDSTFPPFTDLLGDRLEAADDAELRTQACLCYICAGNVEKLVVCWTSAQDGQCPLSLQVRLDEHLEMHHLVFKAVQNIIPQHNNVRQSYMQRARQKQNKQKQNRTVSSSNPIQFTNSFSHCLLDHLKQPGNTLFKT